MAEKIPPYGVLFLIILAIILAGKLLQFFFLFPLVEAAYFGESFEYLNKLLTIHQLKDPQVRDLEFYRSEIPKYVNRLIFLGSVCATLLWFIFRNQKRLFKDFIYEERSALSLSILRISVLLLILYLNFPAALSDVTEMGVGSIVAPPGWSNEAIEILSNPIFIKFITISFLIFSIGSLLGFYTNYMLIGATITGFLAMGIPQFYGKVDSYQILWHVLLILSFSKCGHSLSIDAWRNNHPQINLVKSSAFGMPIKIVMLLMGILYFFPGFWKFIFSGFEWAFSDNLKLKLYSKWLILGDWTPFFRIDYYPFLYRPAALLTMVIETGFIFALFFKKVRPFFLFGALAFHFSVWYLMKIAFTNLIVLYVVFVDWSALAKKFFPKLAKFKTLSHKTAFSLNRNKVFLSIGGFLIFGNVMSGALLIKSWPFSVYPTFASMESETVPSILIRASNDEGTIQNETIPILDPKFQNEFSAPEKLRGFVRSILDEKTTNLQKLSTLSEIFITTNNLEAEGIQLQFYLIRLNSDPDKQPKEYRIGDLIYTFPSDSIKTQN